MTEKQFAAAGRRSLGFRMGIILVIVATLVLSGFGVYQYFDRRNDITEQLNYIAELAAERLSLNLALPVWDAEFERAEKILESEMTERRIQAILVLGRDGERILAGRRRNPEGKVVPVDGPISNPDLIQKQREIVVFDEKLATVTLYVTQEFKREALARLLKKEIWGVVLLDLALLLAMIVSLRTALMRPLNRSIENLGDGFGQMTTGLGQVAAGSQSLAEGAYAQASSIAETSASLDGLDGLIRRNQSSAAGADALIREVDAAIRQATEEMETLTESMNEVSSSGEETFRIVKTIDEIAFQTNLLALNAAVEAARAGEAGAGFAVVAEEVRSLAIRSAEAARNSSELIEGIVRKIRSSAEGVGRTGTSFGRVAEVSEKVNELFVAIRAVSDEQAQGIREINRAVEEIDRVTQLNASNAEESAAATEELNQQARRLKNTVQEIVLRVLGGRRAQIDGGRTVSAASAPTRSTKRDAGTRGRLVRPEDGLEMDEDF